MRNLNALDVLIVILTALLLYLLSTRILGRSATEIQVAVAIFSILITVGFRAYSSLQRQINKLNRELGEFKIETNKNFEEVNKNFNEINKKLDSIARKR